MIENIYNEKISDVKQIANGAGEIVRNREKLMDIVEKPCLSACLTLYDLNIQTLSSSANGKHLDEKENFEAYIEINYDSLDEQNKRILDKLIEEGIVKPLTLSDNPNQRGARCFCINVSIEENDTVGTISDRFMKIVSNFQQQDALYAFEDAEKCIKEITESWGDLLEPDENGKVCYENIYDLIKDVSGYIYDDELNGFWISQELYNKHKEYQKRIKEKDNIINESLGTEHIQ